MLPPLLHVWVKAQSVPPPPQLPPPGAGGGSWGEDQRNTEAFHRVPGLPRGLLPTGLALKKTLPMETPGGLSNRAPLPQLAPLRLDVGAPRCSL